MEEQEINLLELLQVIARRKAVIVKLCGVVAVLAVVYSLTLPNIYTATAKILPPQKETGGGLSALLGQMGGLAGLAGGSMGLGGGSDLYIGILKSRSVGDAVVKRLDLKREFKTKTHEDARRALEGSIKVQAGKDGIITVAADSKDPKMAARLANAMVDELGRKSVQLNLTKAGTERAFLEKRLDVVKQDLKTAETDLKFFQERHKTIKVDSQAAVTIQGIARLKAEIASKEVQLATLQGFQTDESPEVRMHQTSLAKLRSQYAAMAGSGGGDSVIPTVGNVPNLGLAYVRLMRELKIQEAIFEQLTKQYEMAKLSEAKDSSSLQVLDEAVAPLKKSKPKRSLIVILATVTAFFCSIFVIFIQEYCERMPDEDKVRWQAIKDSLSLSRKKKAL
ncbi:MAG: lipopolysaccharide biosynthesis [Geobacteraceae bacterium]|nr:MAG: lipopolysaccharide biosynthesis [Geobacteraceae bacterium]